MKNIQGLGTIIVVVLFMFVKPIVNGFVLMKLWNWYVIPFQTEGMLMTHSIGMGIVLIGMIFTFRTGISDKEDSRGIEEVLDSLWRGLKNSIAIPGIILLIGWILFSLFM